MVQGTKQGNPLSTILFNAVLEDIFGEIKIFWNEKQIGEDVSLGITEILQNLRFADDVLLTGA